jgi:hypothetical protein
MFRPDDERFRINDEATFHSARLTPADKFYRTVAAKLERAEVGHCFTFKTDDVLHIPVHDLPPILREFIRVFPVEVARQASLRGVERVLVAERTRADELADEAHATPSVHDEPEAHEDDDKYQRMIDGKVQKQEIEAMKPLIHHRVLLSPP